MTLSFIWLDAVRLTTAMMALVVVLLLPAALKLRIRITKYGWLLIAAIELAFAENIISTLLRLGKPWNWIVSPLLMTQSILAFLWIMTVDRGDK